MTGIRASIAAILLIVFPLCGVATPYAAIVIDADTGKVLHSENANTRLHPAGLTKLATLYVAFEAIAAGEVGLDDKVRISSNVASEPIAALGMREGQRITIKDLLQASAIKGANDASTAFAEAISSSEQAFTKRIDEMAGCLDMSRSSFMNAHGLNEKGHLSTAADMVILMVELIKKFPEDVLLLGQLDTILHGVVSPLKVALLIKLILD